MGRVLAKIAEDGSRVLFGNTALAGSTVVGVVAGVDGAEL